MFNLMAAPWRSSEKLQPLQSNLQKALQEANEKIDQILREKKEADNRYADAEEAFTFVPLGASQTWSETLSL